MMPLRRWYAKFIDDYGTDNCLLNGLLVFIVVLYVVMALSGVIYSVRYMLYATQRVCHTVKRVDSCTHNGHCGVMYDDGCVDSMHLPVVGERRCIWVVPRD